MHFVFYLNLGTSFQDWKRKINSQVESEKHKKNKQVFRTKKTKQKTENKPKKNQVNQVNSFVLDLVKLWLVITEEIR